MSQVKVIFQDALILFAVSSLFVGLTKYGFSYLEESGSEADPVVTAIHQNKLEDLNTLLGSGKHHLDTTDGHQRTALIQAAYVNYSSAERTAEADEKRAPMIPVLIKHGAKVDAQDGHDWTALMWASWSGMPTVVDQLLKSNASHSIAGRQGYTALSLAAMRGNADIAERLIKAGANTSAKNNQGETALILATNGISKYPDKREGYQKIIALLEKENQP